MGPRAPRSTSLSPQEAAACIAFRKHTLLPLDDCLYALQASIPHLTRSSLHRLFQRHGISRLPETEGGKSKKKFNDCANTKTAVSFLNDLVEAMPYAIHTVLTGNGIQFADLPKNREGPTARWRGHPFDRACMAHGIERRLTKPSHPWTNGQVERMNRTLKEATVRRYHYESHNRLRAHLAAFVDAYNFARRLRTLKGLTPFEFAAKHWTDKPDRFRLNPAHHFPGLNN